MESMLLILKLSFVIDQECFKKFHRQTERRTELQTDKPTCRNSSLELKDIFLSSKYSGRELPFYTVELVPILQGGGYSSHSRIARFFEGTLYQREVKGVCKLKFSKL